MKILQISSATSLGGGERHLADLAGGLARRGHELRVALRPNSPVIDELKLPVGNMTTLALRNSLDVQSARQLCNLVRQNAIQIVHAHMARDYPLAAYAVRNSLQARLIVTRHVLFPLNRLHRITLSRAARIIAVSQAVATQLRNDRVAPPEKISVVLNGIDAGKFINARAKFDRSQFLHDWKLPAEALLIGTVGELTPLKGQEEFLRAAALVSSNFPNAYFIIAGLDHSSDQKYRVLLERRIAEWNLSARVRLVGWLENLAELYCALDVFVSASHTESFGLAVAEAMASATAVVSTKTAGASEIVQDEVTGLLVPVGDTGSLTESLMTLLGDRERRLQIGRAAQKAVSAQFSVERMIDETEEIYRGVIKK